MNTEVLGVIAQIVLMVVLSYPLGKYIAKVYKGEKTWSDFMKPVERVMFKLSGINPNEEMNWKQFLRALLVVNLSQTEEFVKNLRQKCYDAMNDDLATPQVISYLFEACGVVNKLLDHKATICADCLKELADTMRLFAIDLLGLKEEKGNSSDAREKAYGKVVDMVLSLRAKAKAEKDWATSDRIRDELAAAGFEVKDTKDGCVWRLDK